jgi:hypothetical protein
VGGACSTHGRGEKRLWWKCPKDRDHSEDQGVDGRIGSELISRRLAGGGCGVDSVGSGEGPVAGCCEYGDRTSCSGATDLVKYLSLACV